MNPTTHTHDRRLAELSERECWARLATQEVGRLAWQGSEGLTVVPVNYRVESGVVRLRTAAYSTIARECDDSPVAFEVDLIDPETRTGWSVLGRGGCSVEWVLTAPEGRPDTWPSGIRALHLVLNLTRITGRELRGIS